MKQKHCSFKIFVVALALLSACGLLTYLVVKLTDDTSVQLASILAFGFISIGALFLLAVRVNSKATTDAMFEKMRHETRPVLSYLGRVLSPKESPKAETVINSSTLLDAGAGVNIKMSLDTNSTRIMHYAEAEQHTSKDTTPVILIRPFFFANYGKSIAVGLYISLNGEKISFSSDAVLEPNAKIQMEVNDMVRFSKNLKEFTMTYADVYGNEYTVLLDGIIEFAEDESLRLEREVYYFYVDSFLEV